jgi:DNA-binding HxlR family transcriptional regulator
VQVTANSYLKGMAVSQLRSPPANSARRALTILGDRWTLLILRDAFLGMRQFNQWQTRLGIPPSVLTKRLKRLVVEGLFERKRFREVPPRVEYRLTEKARDIYGFALMLLAWEQRWYRHEPHIVLTHKRCGRATEPRCTCGSCHAPVAAHDVHYTPGPGARDEPVSSRHLRRASISAADNRTSDKFLEHVVDLVGDRWTSEVIAAAFFGQHRFDEFQAATGIASNILSHRLRLLTADGVLARRVYQQKPLRQDYVLTAKGLDLYSETVLLIAWGDRWLAGDDGPPLLLFHKLCGEALNPRVTCSACGEQLLARDVSYVFAGGERR